MTKPAFTLLATLALLVPGSARADDLPVASDPAEPPGPAPAPTPPPPAPSPVVTSCSINPCASDCACARRCCPKCGCGAAPKVSLSVTGVRASVTHVDAGRVDDAAFGVAFAGSADSYALDGTTHGSAQFVLGGGEAGFEGMLAGTIDIGYRLPIAESHGPFGRIGFEGRIQGNDLLYFSLIELPRLTLGYQYLDGKTVIEGGARGGAILTGLYDPSEAGRRKLNGLEWGGFVSAQFDFLRADVSVMRIEAKNTLNGTPVDVARAQLCAVAGKVAMCGDGMFFRGDAELRAQNSDVREATAQYLGITVGVAGF